MVAVIIRSLGREWGAAVQLVLQNLLLLRPAENVVIFSGSLGALCGDHCSSTQRVGSRQLETTPGDDKIFNKMVSCWYLVIELKAATWP